LALIYLHSHIVEPDIVPWVEYSASIDQLGVSNELSNSLLASKDSAAPNPLL